MDIASSSTADAGGGLRARAAAAALTPWLSAVAACTLALWLVRDTTHEAHVALAYLLIVLGGSARHGRLVGVVLALSSFLAFNFFLLPPFYTLAIEDPLDWWVLVSFLVTGTVAAELFHRAQSALATAESRAREVKRLSALGAESLSVPRATDAVVAIARVIRAELPIGSAEIATFDEESGETGLLARSSADGSGGDGFGHLPTPVGEGRIVLVHGDGSERVAEAGATLASLLTGKDRLRAVLVPLVVRDRKLGVLRISDPRGLALDGAQAAFADTLSDYAALALERVRLTAQAEHVEALREADRLKDALVASVSHDLRTPLTTIRVLATEMRSSGDERAAVIEEEAERLNRLVTDLLDLSRIRSGALPLELRVTAAEDLVGAMLQRLAGIEGVDRIQVRLPPGGALPVGRFDFVHALRALGNLVENALRHSSAHVSVELEVHEDGSDLVFAVADRGPGVAEADRDLIFEPFYHASGNGQGGTGLGLAIARDVAEAQGGRVVYRTREGGGSIFELRLPRETLEELT